MYSSSTNAQPLFLRIRGSSAGLLIFLLAYSISMPGNNTNKFIALPKLDLYLQFNNRPCNRSRASAHFQISAFFSNSSRCVMQHPSQHQVDVTYDQWSRCCSFNFPGHWGVCAGVQPCEVWNDFRKHVEVSFTGIYFRVYIHMIDSL